MKTRQVFVVVVVAAVVLACLPAAADPAGTATEIEPGRVYDGGARLQVGEYGVTFTVPTGWRGALPQGSEYFIMEPTGGGAMLLATGDEGSLAELRTLLSAPLDLGDGIILRPTGSLAVEGSEVRGQYRAEGSAQPLVGRVVARAGAHGIAVVYGLLAAPDQIERHLAALDLLAASTEMTPRPGAAGGQGGAARSGGDSWAEYLKGKYLVRYYTQTGFTDEQHLWLCSDGTFYRSASSGGFGGGASGAFRGDSSGRWQADGAGESGSLTLRYGDGSVVRHELTYDYDADKLYLDDKRWLRDRNEHCR